MGSNLPREKLERRGLHGLTDVELVAIIVGSGVEGDNFMKISREIVKMIKKSPKRVRVSQLRGLKGVGKVKAMRIACSLELGRRIFGTDLRKIVKDRSDVVRLVEHLKGKKQEYAVVLYLDARNRLISERTVAIGSSNMLVVEPRDVFSTALKNGASSIILVHNHPSGQESPSKADLNFTKRIRSAGKLLGIKLVDHVIV